MIRKDFDAIQNLRAEVYDDYKQKQIKSCKKYEVSKNKFFVFVVEKGYTLLLAIKKPSEIETRQFYFAVDMTLKKFDGEISKKNKPVDLAEYKIDKNIEQYIIVRIDIPWKTQ